MACLPLIERELRVALRKLRPVRERLRFGGVASGGALLFLFLGGPVANPLLGRGLEQLLLAGGFYCVLRAPMLTVGVLSEERRNQTLGLLFLSGLGPGEVFLGKFLSSVLVAFTSLLALFPVLALPFLTGGVSFELFVATVWMLPVCLLFALSLSLLASALTRDDGLAMALVVVLALLICGLPPAVYEAQRHFTARPAPPSWWLRLSPAYGPYVVWSSFGSGFNAAARREFWQNLALTFGWSVLLLGAAAFVLKRIWKERPEPSRASAWRRRWRELAHGSRGARQNLARRWLDENPFVWLSGRDQRGVPLGWVMIVVILAAWLGAWFARPGRWLTALNFMVLAALMSGIISILMRYRAARALAQPRWDGAYEYLLTTPLSPRDIVRGTLMSLRWNFRSLVYFVLGINAILMLGGLFVRKWSGRALLVYGIIWLVLLGWSWSLGRMNWRCLPLMWGGLNCGRPMHVIWRSSGFRGSSGWSWLLLPFYIQIFAGFPGLRGLGKFPTGSGVEMTVVCVVAGVWLLSLLGLADKKLEDVKWDSKAGEWVAKIGAERIPAIWKAWDSRLTRDFREIVREPLPDPSDPRFREWQMHERFPWEGMPAKEHRFQAWLGRRLGRAYGRIQRKKRRAKAR